MAESFEVVSHSEDRGDSLQTVHFGRDAILPRARIYWGNPFISCKVCNQAALWGLVPAVFYNENLVTIIANTIYILGILLCNLH